MRALNKKGVEGRVAKMIVTGSMVTFVDFGLLQLRKKALHPRGLRVVAWA